MAWNRHEEKRHRALIEKMARDLAMIGAAPTVLIGLRVEATGNVGVIYSARSGTSPAALVQLLRQLAEHVERDAASDDGGSILRVGPLS